MRVARHTAGQRRKASIAHQSAVLYGLLTKLHSFGETVLLFVHRSVELFVHRSEHGNAVVPSHRLALSSLIIRPHQPDSSFSRVSFNSFSLVSILLFIFSACESQLLFVMFSLHIFGGARTLIPTHVHSLVHRANVGNYTFSMRFLCASCV